MVERTPVEVVLEFVARINHNDVGGLVALMNEDHGFIDGPLAQP